VGQSFVAGDRRDEAGVRRRGSAASGASQMTIARR
jgi:hypothetical protein